MIPGNKCPHCGGDLTPGAIDARQRQFLVRMRLYDVESPSRDDPIMDSQADQPPDAMGTEVIRGLRNALSECAAAAVEYHGSPLHGFSGPDLDKKERGIRPSLSRRGGRATVRIKYDCLNSFSDGQRAPRYEARIDLQRLTSRTAGEDDDADS